MRLVWLFVYYIGKRLVIRDPTRRNNVQIKTVDARESVLADEAECRVPDGIRLFLDWLGVAAGEHACTLVHFPHLCLCHGGYGGRGVDIRKGLPRHGWGVDRHDPRLWHGNASVPSHWR